MQWQLVFCNVCRTLEVSTRKKCRLCGDRIPQKLFTFRSQASDEEHARHDTSLGEKCLGTAAIQRKTTNHQMRKEKGLVDKSAQLEADLKAVVAVAQVKVCQRKTKESDRRAVGKKKQQVLRERKHIERIS